MNFLSFILFYFIFTNVGISLQIQSGMIYLSTVKQDNLNPYYMYI